MLEMAEENRPKRALIHIVDNDDLESFITEVVESKGYEIIKDPEANDVGVVFTNDEIILKNHAVQDMLVPIIMYGQAAQQYQGPYTEFSHVHPSRKLETRTVLEKALKKRDTQRQKLIDVVVPADEKKTADALGAIIHSELGTLQRKIDEGRVSPSHTHATKEYKRAYEVGAFLRKLLSRSRQEFSVKLGEGAYGEGSGHNVGGRVFVKALTDVDLPGLQWTHREIANQRYKDALIFKENKNYRTAAALPPLHYDGISLMFFDYIPGPTLEKVLREVAAEKDKSSSHRLRRTERDSRKKMLNGISRGLVRRRVEQLKQWIKITGETDMYRRQEGEDVYEYYLHALQTLPEKLAQHVPIGTFSQEEHNLWRDVCADILRVLNYDKKYIVRYEDETPQNVIILGDVMGEQIKKGDIWREFAEGFTEKDVRRKGKVSRKITIDDTTRVQRRITNMSSHDPRQINIDTPFRHMHVLEDVLHLLEAPEVWNLTREYFEANLRPSFIEYAASLQDFDPNKLGEKEWRAIGFYRSARKMGNLTKYGRNAFDEMNSHRTTRGRYKRRIKRFTKDMKHFATIAKGMVDQLGSAVLESVLHGDGIEKAMKLAYAYDDITLNKVIAKQLKKERESIPSDEARLVYGTAIVQLYLNKFMKNFRGLSYK